MSKYNEIDYAIWGDHDSLSFKRMFLMETEEGEEFVKKMEELFPMFSKVTIHSYGYEVEVSSGSYSYNMILDSSHGDQKNQHTVELGDTGMYIEVSYNQVRDIVMPWLRDTKLKDLGI